MQGESSGALLVVPGTVPVSFLARTSAASVSIVSVAFAAADAQARSRPAVTR